ncbi:MAG: hypothetical protein ACXWG8_10275 [Usitatibacter sp.]
MSDLFSKLCECCKTRGSVYEASCPGCIARRTARCPKVVRFEIYEEFAKRMGIDALPDFKAAVKEEWEMDQQQLGAKQ